MKNKHRISWTRVALVFVAVWFAAHGLASTGCTRHFPPTCTTDTNCVAVYGGSY